MALRINPDVTPSLLAALNLSQRQSNTLLAQLGSGRRVNAPEDDPAAAAALVQTHADFQAADQFLRNTASLRSVMQTADSSLSSVVTALTRAISLGVEGANGTLSAENRAAMAQEVQGLQQQLLGLANLSFQGTYVFSGTAVGAAPFVLDSSSPSGVSYVGNQSVNSVEISSGENVAVNVPGSQIFSQSGNDMFLAIQHLITALQSGSSDAVGTATNEVQKAFDYVNAQRVFYGNAINRLDATDRFLNQEKVQLSSQENGLVAADLADTISSLSKVQTSRTALLQAASRVSQVSLMDFLR